MEPHKKITLNDLQLASAYYPLLVDMAKSKSPTLTYGQLVEKAKKAHPSSATVQNAIATSTGRKLEVVRMFTTERNLPDLTSLVVSKGGGECGDAYTKQFDAVAERDKISAFDWSAISTAFDGYIQHTEASIFPRKRIKRPEALKAMSQYYSQHRSKLPENIVTQRDLIIELLMEGLSAEDAFDEAAKEQI